MVARDSCEHTSTVTTRGVLLVLTTCTRVLVPLDVCSCPTFVSTRLQVQIGVCCSCWYHAYTFVSTRLQVHIDVCCSAGTTPTFVSTRLQVRCMLLVLVEVHESMCATTLVLRSCAILSPFQIAGSTPSRDSPSTCTYGGSVGWPAEVFFGAGFERHRRDAAEARWQDATQRPASRT